MPTEPLTGARYPDSSYAVDVPQDIQNAVFDLADNTIPFFTSTAARDTDYASWVSNGGAMRNGLTCHVGATRYVYVSGAWVADVIGYQNRMMQARRETDTAGFPSGAWTSFAANTNWTETDPWGMHNSGANLTAVWTGWYQINFSVFFNNDANGVRGIRLMPSAGANIGEGAGSPVNLMIVNAAGGGNDTALNASWLCQLTAGQTVDGQAYQNTGAGMQINYVGISVAYLGPNT